MDLSHQDSCLEIVKVHLWSELKVLGKIPCSYKSSSGTVTTRYPPGLRIRNQLLSPASGSSKCSRQWLEWTNSYVSSSTPSMKVASPSPKSQVRTSRRRGNNSEYKNSGSGAPPISIPSPAKYRFIKFGSDMRRFIDLLHSFMTASRIGAM